MCVCVCVAAKAAKQRGNGRLISSIRRHSSIVARTYKRGEGMNVKQRVWDH
jgi:hypothetical protein